MPHIDIIAIGKLKKGSFYELKMEYEKRIRWPLNIFEYESRYKEPKTMNDDENRKIMDHISADAFVIVLDEHGDGLRSVGFAETIEKLQNTGEQHLQFIIGGADGLSEEVKARANLLMSFGQQTWPHMMARIMLLEQIYRAQQIIAGHPYHRE